MSQDMEEREPLLPVQLAQQPKPKKKIIVPLVISGLLIISYFIVYFIYIPPKIQEAVDGNGSDIRHVHLLDVDPIRANISVRIPVDPLPLNVDIQIGKMVVSSEHKPLAKFLFPRLVGEVGVDQLWCNDTIEMEQVDHAWISWFLKQSITHGLKKTEISLTAIPRVHIPLLMGTWPANINQLYTISPGLSIDPKQFDFKTANVQVTPTQTPTNQSYFIVTMDTSFTNPFPISMQAMSIQLQTTIYFRNKPLFTVSTHATDPLELLLGRNNLFLKIVTVPEYTNDLMEFIGRISDGIETLIVIGDLKVNGDRKWQWVQDMIDGWSIPYLIPRIDDIPMTLVRE